VPAGNGVGDLHSPYTVVNLPDGITEQDFMNGINTSDNWNNGLYFPFVNDCHNDLERAFNNVGVDYPGAPNGRLDIDDDISQGFNDYLRMILTPPGVRY